MDPNFGCQGMPNTSIVSIVAFFAEAEVDPTKSKIAGYTHDRNCPIVKGTLIELVSWL